MAHGEVLLSGGISFGSVERACAFSFQLLTPLYITHSTNTRSTTATILVSNFSNFIVPESHGLSLDLRAEEETPIQVDAENS